MIIYLAAIDAPEDQDTFVALYERPTGTSCSMWPKILANEADAEDAVHDAFVTVAEKNSSFFLPGRHKTRSLLVTIVEHKGHRPLPEEAAPGGGGPWWRDLRHRPRAPRRTPPPGPVHPPPAWAVPRFFRLKYELGYSTREAGQLMEPVWAAARKLEQQAGKNCRHFARRRDSMTFSPTTACVRRHKRARGHPGRQPPLPRRTVPTFSLPSRPRWPNSCGGTKRAPAQQGPCAGWPAWCWCACWAAGCSSPPTPRLGRRFLGG